MHRLAESKLLAGFIYGDPHMQEYIYLPASELDHARLRDRKRTP